MLEMSRGGRWVEWAMASFSYKCPECGYVAGSSTEVQQHIKDHLDRKLSTKLSWWDRRFLKELNIKPWEDE